MDATTPGRGAREGWWPPHGAAADALLAGAVGVFVILGTYLWPPSGPIRLSLVSWILVLTAVGALYFRRRHPVLVTLVTLVACSFYYPLTEPDGPVLVTFVVALFTTAAEGSLIAAVTLGVAALLARRRRRAGAPPRSGCASPGSCTTCSATTSR
ncbi:MAG: hypothetical protein GEV11_27675 [Streptosporangiales bacterium]|nr:hypothetical protein [Streptosporangiales bacterium]